MKCNGLYPDNLVDDVLGRVLNLQFGSSTNSKEPKLLLFSYYYLMLDIKVFFKNMKSYAYSFQRKLETKKSVPTTDETEQFLQALGWY